MMVKVLQRLWRNFIRRAALFLAGIFLVFGVTTGITLFNYYLPVYLETDLLPSLAHQAGIGAFSCDVRSIGLNHADISDLHFGSAEINAVRIDSVRLDYSVKGLSERHISRIIISDPEFQLHHRDGQWRIKGLNWDAESDNTQHPQPPKTDSGALFPESNQLPVTIGKIIIRNAVLVIAWQGHNFKLPFDIEITPQNISTSLRRVDSIIHLYPAGQELVCKAAIDFVRKHFVLSLDADNLQVAKLKDYLPLPDDILLNGNMEIHAKFSSAIDSLNLTGIMADLYFRNFKASYEQMVLENSHLKENEQTIRPLLHIRLMGKSAQICEFTVMNLAVSNPVNLNLETFSGILETQADQIRATGNYAMIATPGDRPASKFSFKPLKIKGQYQANVKPDGAWDLLTSASARKAQIRSNQLTFISSSQQVTITGQGEKGVGDIRFDANVNDWKAFYLNAADNIFKGKAITLKGRMIVDDAPNHEPQITFSIKSPVNGLMNKNVRFEIPTFITTGQAKVDKHGRIRFNGQIRLKDAWVNDSETGTALNGINVKLPLQWPCPRTGAKGFLTIKKLQWQQQHLGSLKATLNQKNKGGVFTANYFSTIAPNLTAALSGKLNLSSSTDYQAEIDFQASRYQTGDAIDITRFLSQAKGFTFNGDLHINGGLTILPSSVSGRLRSEIKDARIELKETGLILEGVDVLVNIPDLPKIQSGPGQVFRFKKATLGNLKFDNGKIKFKIESVQSFLIETGEFGWCNGHVDTPAIRIKAGVKDYSGVLYCDRLNFSMLLNQLGDVKADGQGTVNGRLPIQLVNNKISFQDGFLYSTPGEGGTIQIISTSFGQADMLSNGLLPDNAQIAQIELAREALKDYTYKWVKLNLTTQGELLKARLQMDGKPAKPLPFIYDKKLGAFTRVKAGAGSRFQGIRLNVNFSLPLNKILHYGTKLQ